jgi:hypothetical protein
MGPLQQMQVPSQVDHDERRVSAMHKGDHLGNRQAWRIKGEPMDKNRIGGTARQGDGHVLHYPMG